MGFLFNSLWASVVQAPRKAPVSAAVWDCFGFPESDLEQTTVHCKVCSKFIAAKGSSTTNLFQHLRQRLPAQGGKCGSLPDAKDCHRAQTPVTKQVTLVESFSMCPYDTKGTRRKEIPHVA